MHPKCYKPRTWYGKSRFTVVSLQNTEFILALLFNYCIIVHTNNCKSTFAPLCIHKMRKL